MILLIENANQLITLQGTMEKARTKEEMSNLQIIDNGSVLISGDRIIATGTKASLRAHYPDLVSQAKIIDATGKVVMPGLVDAHTHLVFGGTRENEFQMRLNGATYMDIMNAGGGIHATTKKHEKHHLNIFMKKHMNISMIF